jgi:hypothetical protein
VYPIASKSVYTAALLPVTYWVTPAKVKHPRMTADPSNALKYMPIIVAPDLTVEKAALPLALCALIPALYPQVVTCV